MSQGILMGNMKAIGVAQITVDLPSVAAQDTADVLVDLPGAMDGDILIPNILTAGLVGSGGFVVSGQPTIKVANVTAAPIDAAAAPVSIVWLRPVSKPAHARL